MQPRRAPSCRSSSLPEIAGSASSWIARMSWPIVPLNACGNHMSSQVGALPAAVHGPCRPGDRRRAAGRVVGPADRALRDALGSLDAPLDAVVGPRVAVVQADRAQPVGVLEDVERAPVLRRVVEARVVAHRDEDPLGVTELEAERVEVVDRHVEQRDAPVLPEELLPVRSRVHHDLGHDRRAELARVEQRPERPHRLVVAHVVVHAELDAGLVA